MKCGADLYQGLATALNEERKDFKILAEDKHKKRVDILDNEEPYTPTEGQTLFYNLKVDYKTISFTCQANGLWKPTLLEFFDKTCRPVANLRLMQPVTLQGLADEVLLTIAGIHIL